MLWSKKPMKIEDLKEDEEAYNSLLNELKLTIKKEESEELKNAKATIAELKNVKVINEIHSRIKEYGAKLKVSEIAEKAISEGLSFNVALLNMVDEHLKNVKNFTESFNDTSSDGVGSSPFDSDEVEPKSFAEAINLIAKRDNITKKEAAEKAKIEFKKLFDSMYEIK